MGLIRDIVVLVKSIVKNTFNGSRILLKKAVLKVKIVHLLYKKRTNNIQKRKTLHSLRKNEIY